MANNKAPKRPSTTRAAVITALDALAEQATWVATCERHPQSYTGPTRVDDRNADYLELARRYHNVDRLRQKGP